MTFALTTVLAAAERANAAYVTDQAASQAAFEALGLQWHGLYQNSDHQAVLSSDAFGRTYLSISGTRFSDGKLGDIFDDLETGWVNVGQGAQVLAGAYSGCRELFGWAQGVAGVGPLCIEGHSLGGWRARYAPLFMDPSLIAQLLTFESPRSANASYYDRFKTVFGSVALSVVNGHDIFVDWPWLSNEARHPPQTWWHLLEDGSLSVEDPSAWPGGLSRDDHDIANVAAKLRALVALSAATAAVPPLGTPPAPLPPGS